MTTPPFPGWQDTASEARFSDPAQFARSTDRLTRNVRIRNAIEYIAGGLVIVLFGASAVDAMIKGEWLIAVSLALVVAGTLMILWNLRKRASNLVRLPEEPCLAHLRRQYAHQYAALRAVPVWYIGPLVPGVALLYLAIGTRVAERTDFVTSIEGLLGPAAITFGIFGMIIAANLLAARALKRKIAELDALA